MPVSLRCPCKVAWLAQSGRGWGAQQAMPAVGSHSSGKHSCLTKPVAGGGQVFMGTHPLFQPHSLL